MMMMKRKTNQSSKSKDECMKKRKIKLVVNKSDTNHVSEDLIMEILLRLPPTSILRFKYVCNSWYSLISKPDFLRIYSSSLQFYKHSTDEELMVSSYLDRNFPLKYQKKEHPLLKCITTPPSGFPSELLDCYTINSCNGLLLLRSEHDIFSGTDATYYVCNPITNRCFKIPSISIIRNLNEENTKYMTYHHPPYILFDPSTSLPFKLIRCLIRIAENKHLFYELYVYSSETGSWRLLTSFPTQRTIYCDPPVLLNGIFYWKAYNGVHLLSVDLKKMSMCFLPLPPKPMEYSKTVCLYFGQCDGSLRLILKHFVSNTDRSSQLTFPCSFDIMETEPQQQQQVSHLTWSVKYHVDIETDYDHLIKNHFFTVSIIHLYKTKNKGEEEALLLSIDGMVVPFNLESNTFGKVLTRHLPPLSDFSTVFPYNIMTLFHQL